MINVGRRPIHLFYNPLVNGPLNNLSNLRTFPHLFIVLRNHLAFLTFSSHELLENRRVATAVYRTKQNVPISRNKPIFIDCNLSSPSANVYYYPFLLPNRPLTHLQYIILL